MAIANGDRSILDWDEDQVHEWLSKVGFPQFHQQIKGRTFTYSLGLWIQLFSDHHIAGDVLCMLDSESLKTIGVLTVGHRIAILKAIYQAKVAHHVPFESHHYVPPCGYLIDVILGTRRPYLLYS